MTFNIQPVESATTIIVPDDYAKIQWAIGNASAGDTIFVRAGTYHEHLTINKSLSLVGENKETTIIDGGDAGNVIHVFGTYGTLIKGFTIQKGWSYGIYTYFSGRAIVNDNIVSSNLYGVRIEQSGDTYVTNNQIRSNKYGISHWHSDGSIITDNLITNNTDGVLIAYSKFTTLRNNNMTENTHNFGLWSYGMAPYGTFDDFIHDIDTSNTVDGKPLYYWVNRQNEQIPEDAGYVGVANSTNITVKNLNLTNNGQGVLLAFCTDCTVENVSVSNSLNGIRLVRSSFIRVNSSSAVANNHGIYVALSNNNTIIANAMLDNTDFGITIDHTNGTMIVGNTILENQCGIGIDGATPLNGGKYNVIHHNNFINNTNQAYLYPIGLSSNVWDDGISEGNYWSDYNGTESDGDGIGDTPYIIDENNQDNYPLMSPYEYWSNPILGDVNKDMKVDYEDLSQLKMAYGSTPKEPNWNPNCDLDGDNKLDVLDLFDLGKNYGKAASDAHACVKDIDITNIQRYGGTWIVEGTITIDVTQLPEEHTRDRGGWSWYNHEYMLAWYEQNINEVLDAHGIEFVYVENLDLWWEIIGDTEDVIGLRVEFSFDSNGVMNLMWTMLRAVINMEVVR